MGQSLRTEIDGRQGRPHEDPFPRKVSTGRASEEIAARALLVYYSSAAIGQTSRNVFGVFCSTS